MFATTREKEESILLSVAILGDKAYPARVAEMLRKTSRTFPIGAVHSMLDRFERQGILTSSCVTPKNKFPRKRIYRLTDYGRREKNIPLLKETLKKLLPLSGH